MWHRLRQYFLSGLVVFLPLSLTIYIFFILIQFADNLLGRYLAPYFYENFGFYIQGFSILVGVIVVLLIGFFVTNFIGRRLYEFAEKVFIQLPIVKQVYPALKEMAMFLFSGDRVSRFKQVVIIEYPRKGIYSFGFFTNESSRRLSDFTGEEMCNIFVPSAPGPLTGFAVMIPKKDVILTDITVEEAFKFILSGGVVNPPVTTTMKRPEGGSGK